MFGRTCSSIGGGSWTIGRLIWTESTDEPSFGACGLEQRVMALSLGGVSRKEYVKYY